MNSRRRDIAIQTYIFYDQTLYSTIQCEWISLLFEMKVSKFVVKESHPEVSDFGQRRVGSCYMCVDIE